jgi:hypothetical protein
MRSSSHPACRPRPRFRFLALAFAALAPSELPAQFGAIGLSGVGAQHLPNWAIVPDYLPEGGDQFGAAFATGDFNGDGADDLAIGNPAGDATAAGEVEFSGIVVVHYGIPGVGLPDGPPALLLSQANPGSPDAAESSDQFGTALAVCDFNGDGFDDLAVGVPGETDDGAFAAGAVDVFYGSSAGLAAVAAQHLTQNSGFPVIDEGSEFDDNFGAALACGELVVLVLGETIADLAIGVPDETLQGASGPLVSAGMVLVARGTASGLAAAGSLVFHQDIGAMADAPESFDGFGFALAVLDLNGDGFDDLAVGVPGEDGTSQFNGRGAVHLVFGTASGLATVNNGLVRESDLTSNSELGDRFGAAVAAGDFDGDGFDDLAIGGPTEDLDAVVDTGQVIAVYGRAAPPFFDLARRQLWAENNIHGAGTSEAGDQFGTSLVSGDFDRDGFDDLAVGHPFEDIVVPDDGVTTVVMGGPSGLSNARRHGLAAGYHGNPGVPDQIGREYGFALATGDFDGDGYDDLAIGAPFEDDLALSSVGGAVALYGSLFADGLEVGNTGFWSSAAP